METGAESVNSFDGCHTRTNDSGGSSRNGPGSSQQGHMYGSHRTSAASGSSQSGSGGSRATSTGSGYSQSGSCGGWATVSGTGSSRSVSGRSYATASTCNSGSKYCGMSSMLHMTCETDSSTAEPLPAKIKTEPGNSSVPSANSQPKITISMEQFSQLQAQNVLSVKTDVSGAGLPAGTTRVAVGPNCRIRMVDGVLKIQTVKPGASPVAQTFETNPAKQQKKTTPRAGDRPPKNRVFNQVASYIQRSFPSLQVRRLTWGRCDEITVAEITRRQADVPRSDVTGENVTNTVDVNTGPQTIAKVLLFTKTRKAELRFLGTEKPIISKMIGKDGGIDFDEFDKILVRLSQNYAICAGIPVGEFEDECTLAVLRHLPDDVVKNDSIYRSIECMRSFDRTDSSGIMRDRCPSCCEAFQKACNRSDNPVEFFQVGEPSEGYFSDPVELLSIEEMRSRIKSVTHETKILMAKKRRVERLAANASSKVITKEGDSHETGKETKVVQHTFKCTICQRKFRNASLLLAHKSKHTRKFVCDICQKGFYTKHILKGHEKIHGTDRPHKCSFCGKGFLVAFQLMLHTRVHTGEKLFKCQDCDKAFGSKGSLHSHRLRRHSEWQHVCEYCAKSFATISALNLHLRIHTGEKRYECRYCGWRFVQQGHLAKHESTHVKGIPKKGNKLACGTCNGIFDTADLLKKHAVIHSLNPLETPFKCQFCPLEFRNVRQKNFHECTHSDFSEYAHGRGEKGFWCNVCSKKFSQQSYLTIHNRYHTGETPYKCAQCSKAFAQKSALTTHQLSKHASVKPHKCPHCGKRFGLAGTLRNHLRVHTGEKPFRCRYCKATFRQEGHRSQHECLHTGNKRYGCDHCEKRFIQKNDLLNHIRTHTGEKPFKCGYCDASFAQKHTVKIHERQHTDERPYGCDKCSKRFRQKCTLKQHLEQLH